MTQLGQEMLGELQGQKSLRLCLAWLRIRGYPSGSRPSLWFWATVTRRAAWQGSAIRMTIVAF